MEKFNNYFGPKTIKVVESKGIGGFQHLIVVYTINKYLIKISDKSLVKRCHNWYNLNMKNFLANTKLVIVTNLLYSFSNTSQRW